MRKLASGFFVLLGAALAAFTLWLCLTNLDSDPTLLKAPEAATQSAQTLMDSISSGDYASAQGVLRGQPSLGLQEASENPVSRALRQMYQESISYSILRDCYVTGSGLAVDVSVTALDLPAVMADVSARLPALLTQQAEQAEDRNALLDENGHYTEAFIQEVLCGALEDLAPEAAYGTHTITLNLKYEQDTWWVVPEQAVLRLISGLPE